MTMFPGVSALLAGCVLAAYLLVPVAHAQPIGPPSDPNGPIWIGAKPLAAEYRQGAEITVTLMTNRRQGICGISFEFIGDVEYADEGEGIGIPASDIDGEGRCGWTFTLPDDAPPGGLLVTVLVLSQPGRVAFIDLSSQITPRS